MNISASAKISIYYKPAGALGSYHSHKGRPKS